MTEPIIINQFQNAVANSPHEGIGLMRCVDIEAFPGALKVGKVLTSLFVTAFSGTFTAVAGTDIITVSGFTVPSTGTAVVLTTTGTLPAGLSLATTYFVIRIDDTTCKLATTIALANAGTQIDITDAGTGTHTMTSRNPGTINHIIKDPRSGVRFFHDSNARVWYLTSGNSRALLLNGNTLTNGVGNGLGLLINSDTSATYLFVFRNATIDVINVHATSNLETPSWSTAWQNMNSSSGSGNRHHAIRAQDNIVYFTDDRYIGSIRELTVFDPATAGTYTYNSQALDTPQGEVLEHLDELGVNLLAAGGTFDKIYPWDRTSDSYLLPIQVPERGVKRIKNMGGIVYILAGTLGNIYTSQGSYARFLAKIPDQMSNNSGSLQSNVVTWGGIDALGGKLLFGAGVLTSGNSGAYFLYPDGRLLIDQIPSTGSTNVTALEVTNNFYYLGYSGGADQHDTNRYSSFQGVVQSQFYKVATKTEKGTFSELEVIIAKPATSGNVRVSYRLDTSSAFTTLATFTADSTNTTFNSDIGLTDIENIQIQAEIDGTVELMEIRLFP